MKIEPNKNHVMNIRIDDELNDMLDAISDMLKIPKSFLVRRVLHSYCWGVLMSDENKEIYNVDSVL